MNVLKELEKNGVMPIDKLNTEDRNKIARNITDKLTSNVKELSDSYNELFMRIANCDMFYAKIDSKFRGVFYYYKNNGIYIDNSYENTDSYLIHEMIHYLQNFDNVNKKIKRAGLCQFLEFKLWGLGINEAVVQYITAKAQGEKLHRINSSKISICSNSTDYKFLTSLASQILFLIGEEKAIKSCIHSTEDFEEELYNTFEESTDKIINGFDTIFEEIVKEEINIEKIINTYMLTQELIYKTYFKKALKRIENERDIDYQVKQLDDYENIIGKTNENNTWEENFVNFKNEMESNYLKKYMEIGRRQQNSLIVISKNVFYNIFNKIFGFLRRKQRRRTIIIFLLN